MEEDMRPPSLTDDEMMELKKRLSVTDAKSRSLLRIINLLKNARVTKDQLKRSKIGKIIKELSTRVFPEGDFEGALVRVTSGNIVSKWRGLLEEEKIRSKQEEFFTAKSIEVAATTKPSCSSPTSNSVSSLSSPIQTSIIPPTNFNVLSSSLSNNSQYAQLTTQSIIAEKPIISTTLTKTAKEQQSNKSNQSYATTSTIINMNQSTIPQKKPSSNIIKPQSYASKENKKSSMSTSTATITARQQPPMKSHQTLEQPKIKAETKAQPAPIKQTSKFDILPQRFGSQEEYILQENPVYANPMKKDSLPKYRSVTRCRGLEGIYNTLTRVKEEMSVSLYQWVELAVQLEQHIFMRNQLANNYKSHVREVVGMLKQEDVVIHIVSKLLMKEISFKDVADAKSDVFLTEEARRIIQKQQDDELAATDPYFYNNIRKQRLAGKVGEMCRNCKNNTAFITKELQTRSADEPMTRFMECNNCGKTWRD